MNKNDSAMNCHDSCVRWGTQFHTACQGSITVGSFRYVRLHRTSRRHRCQVYWGTQVDPTQISNAVRFCEAYKFAQHGKTTLL